MKKKHIKASKKNKSSRETVPEKITRKAAAMKFPVVGIGSSAGGMEASSELLRNEDLQNRNVELRQSHDHAEAITDTMSGPLIVLISEMRIRTANKAFYNFFHVSQEETEGVIIYELIEREWNIPALRDHLKNLLTEEPEFKDFQIDHDFPRIGNRTMLINAHKLVQEGDGKETLILLSFEDISRYKKAEKALMKTQEQLELALVGGAVGTWSWNLKTNEIRLSKVGQALYGIPEASFQTYDEWKQVVYDEDLAPTQEAFKRSIEKKTPIDVEFRIVWPDKSIHWILIKAKTYYDTEGKPEKIAGVKIDVTDRRSAHEALEESERRFHIMSDHAPVMIWMAGPDRQCNFLNKTWLSFTGKKLHEECGEGWISGIHPEDREPFRMVYYSSFDKQNEFKIDYRLKRYDGEYRWIMNHGVPRFTGNEKFIGFIGTCIDITDRIDLERQKDDFMGIASHELKTPVTSIKAYAQILQQKFRKANDFVSANMLTRLDLQIDKLTGLINTLLDVARIQSGQMDYDETYFDINEFILEVTEEMQRASPDHIIVTNLKASGKVYGDKDRINQVLTNLISNAVKYSPPSTNILVETKRDADNITISVEDFGSGISKDMQDKIFGRFFRVSESAGNRVSGLGLGLFISSEIVKQHGGKLWLESEPGKGSKFFFSLSDRKGNHELIRQGN